MPKHSHHTLEAVREEIVRLLTEAAPDHLKTNELSKKLGIPATAPDYELVREALDQLTDEGTITRGARRRYHLAIPDVAIEGELQMAGRNRWIVMPSKGMDTPIEIDPRNTWTALHGDTVRVKITIPARFGERPEGEVVRVLHRAADTVVGTLKHGKRTYYLEPDDKKIHRVIGIFKNQIGVAKVGEKVLVKLREWNDPYDDPEGTIIRTLGPAGEMGAEIAAIALKHRLPHHFPDEVVAQAQAFPETIPPEELAARRDIRAMNLFTIDPHDARDFDDAVSIEEHEEGEVTVGVHIADVSYYVPQGSPLDQEALKRGTSVYLVTGVIPMLPERLSNNLCSLRPDEDRLAYSVFVRLSARGAIRGYEILKTVMRSKRRFTYEEALQVLQTGEGDFAHELLALNRIAHVLRQNRHRKGSVDFDRAELRFKLDDNNQPTEVVQKHATESTRLIEDCMLLANRVVAQHIATRKFPTGKERGANLNPFIYRIHDTPPKDKLQELAAFVKRLGYNLPTDNVQPKDIQKLIDSVRGSEHEETITELTLRSMAKAVYSEHNIGHFGLAFQHYTHFTSPIRRYPDLIVHRMLAEYEAGMPVRQRNEYAATLGPIADQCSERERAAVEAERDSIKIAQVQFVKRHVGDTFAARISGVLPFGMFAQITELGIEGLVRVKMMDDDFYIFDEATLSFRGRNTRRTYRIGDPITVRVVRVDELRAEIDMELVPEETTPANAPHQQPRKDTPRKEKPKAKKNRKGRK
ncbi:MAG: ribonuclease R [Chlorobi bacterium]|nr:MAG: exoribonuclease R [Chlorobi bacterium OLB7]MBK8912179.1 ribonuclease R [Chlorobiota bacterium]MBX7215898.1 ribonuclease R [Candidatus Kapabacteria bacterium]